MIKKINLYVLISQHLELQNFILSKLWQYLPRYHGNHAIPSAIILVWDMVQTLSTRVHQLCVPLYNFLYPLHSLIHFIRPVTLELKHTGRRTDGRDQSIMHFMQRAHNNTEDGQ
jgi:hypothetical protein